MIQLNDWDDLSLKHFDDEKFLNSQSFLSVLVEFLDLGNRKDKSNVLESKQGSFVFRKIYQDVLSEFEERRKNSPDDNDGMKS